MPTEPSVPAAGRAGGRERPGTAHTAQGPLTPHTDPPDSTAPSPGSAPPEVPGPPEVPPSGSSAATTSGRGAKWLRHHRVSWGEDRERDRPDRGQLRAAGGPEQGQPFLRRGSPCPVPLGLCGKDRSLSVRGVPCRVPGRGARGTGSSEPRSSHPVSQQRGHGEPPALCGPHCDGAERKRGGGVRRSEQVRIGGNRGARAPQPGRQSGSGGLWARRGPSSFPYWVQNQNLFSRR